MTSPTVLFTKAELDRDPRINAVAESHERWRETATRVHRNLIQSYVALFASYLQRQKITCIATRQAIYNYTLVMGWIIASMLLYITHRPMISPITVGIASTFALTIFTVLAFVRSILVDELEQYEYDRRRLSGTLHELTTHMLTEPDLPMPFLRHPPRLVS